jgi:hypothetical protein
MQQHLPEKTYPALVVERVVLIAVAGVKVALTVRESLQERFNGTSSGRHIVRRVPYCS